MEQIKPKYRLGYISITIFYMAGILYYSLQSYKGDYIGIARENFNNFLHIPVYGLLAYFIFKCFSSRVSLTYVFTLIIATLYGIIIELIQLSVPGRFSSLMDMFLNTIGVTISLGCIYRFNAIRRTRYATCPPKPWRRRIRD